MRRRLLALAAIVAAVVAMVAVVLVSRREGEKRPTRFEARAEALAYAARRAPAVVAIDSRAPAVALALQGLAPRLAGGGLTADELRGVLGYEAVLVLLDPRGRRSQLSLVAGHQEQLRRLVRRLRPAGAYRAARLYAARRGSMVAVRGRALLLAPDAAAARRALDVRADPRAHLTPQSFDARLAGLPPTAATRAVFDPRALIAAELPAASRTRWVRALRNGAAVLAPGRDGLHAPFRLQTEAAGLSVADLPIATGPRTPIVHGDAPLTVSVRDLAHVLAFARAADPRRFAALDRLQDGLPDFLRIDIDALLGALTGDATITSSDLAHVTVRTDPRDPEAWRRPLEGLSALSGLLQRLGVDDVEIDEEPGEAYRLELEGALVGRAGVFGPTLVATDDERTDLGRTATAPPTAPPRGAVGALVGRVRAQALRALLARRLRLPPEAGILLPRVGDLTGWARAETDGVRGELRLGVR